MRQNQTWISRFMDSAYRERSTVNPGTYIQDITELDAKKERTTQLLKSYRECSTMKTYDDMTDNEKVEYWKKRDIQGNDSDFKKVEPPKDMVNSPAHYNSGGIECIDAMRAMLGPEGFRAYCKGSAFKYTWRSGLKFDEDEDLKKAVWYTRMANDDDPRLDPNEALKAAALKYHGAIADGTLTVDDPPDDVARGNNYAYWSEAAKLAGWTPPPKKEPNKVDNHPKGGGHP